ncbi:MAG: PepSY domain-containing protein [Glaciimonas sp.]|nr:PepSY domain-containing protein [Glaciimonas sp.]
MLMVAGFSGATLSFREEVLDLLNPGMITITTNIGTPLTPDQLIQRLQEALLTKRVAQVTVFANLHGTARVNFAPEQGVKQGDLRYLNAVMGELLPPLQGVNFFAFVERLHRWLLASKEVGKVLTGSAAFCLIVMVIYGLYLRWSLAPLAWRNWFKVNFALTGRAFLKLAYGIRHLGLGYVSDI